MKYTVWEKQLICLAGHNFSCHKTHYFKPKLVLQVAIANSIELLMLILDFIMNCAKKYSVTVHGMALRGCVKEERKKEENDTFCTLGVGMM